MDIVKKIMFHVTASVLYGVKGIYKTLKTIWHYITNHTLGIIVTSLVILFSIQVLEIPVPDIIYCWYTLMIFFIGLNGLIFIKR